MDAIEQLITRNRSVRRFDEKLAIAPATLRWLIGLARLSATGGNLQQLKYITSCSPQANAKIYENIGWAAYLPDWPGPAEGERPTGYVVVLGDTDIHKVFGMNPGIAAQSILLGATEKGLGGCMLAAFHEVALREAFDLPDHLRVLLVIALGVPAETVVIDPIGPDGKIEYWRDAQGIHHVPKRDLDELIFAAY